MGYVSCFFGAINTEKSQINSENSNKIILSTWSSTVVLVFDLTLPDPHRNPTPYLIIVTNLIHNLT
jgi:hypothetical protein